MGVDGEVLSRDNKPGCLTLKEQCPSARLYDSKLMKAATNLDEYDAVGVVRVEPKVDVWRELIMVHAVGSYVTAKLMDCQTYR